MAGKRFKRKQPKQEKTRGLTAEDLEWLVENTSFSRENIIEWHKGFMEDCPDGNMDKEKMKNMFNTITASDEEESQSGADAFLEQLFRIFDKNGDGSIDFKEFMVATDMTSRGDPEEKLRWAFRMYDKDGSGEIDLEEMEEIFRLMYSLQGHSDEDATERADRIFKTLDINDDGTLEEDEFVKGCMEDEEMMELLNSGAMG